MAYLNESHIEVADISFFTDNSGYKLMAGRATNRKRKT
jgi:hypothetical protein